LKHPASDVRALTEDCRRLTAVIPGLCGPALDTPATDYLSDPLPALERLLSRARFVSAPGGDPERLLAAYFHVLGAEDVIPAAGPLSWLADSGERPTGFIMRADPIHLRADQACLRLFDSATFDLDADEAHALVAAFNDHFGPRGMRLHAPLPLRWYLTLDRDPELATVAPARLAGRDIGGGMPRGKAGAQWHALLNEVQMLFYGHPVNEARAQRGEPPVNSIWPWGGGCLPSHMIATVSDVYADAPTLRGLARLAGIPARDIPGTAAELLTDAHGGLPLVWLDRLERAACYGEVEAWSDEIVQLEQAWFGPLLELLQARRIGALALHVPGLGSYEITRRRLRRFWKARRPLARHCGQV
jgi:hypothetical protein